MRITGRQLIDGEELVSSDETFQAVNPADGRELEPLIHEGMARDVDHAAKAAERDFEAFRNAPAERRAVLLETVGEELLALGDELLDRAGAETGLPRPRLEGERLRTVNQLRLFAQVVRDGDYRGIRIIPGDPARTPLPKPDLRLRYLPLGPVAVFGAGNFPLAFSVAGGDTASALAAGWPVLAKGHPAHPGTSELAGRAIVAALRRCDLPPGVFALLQGSSHQLGASLVVHPLVRALAFTGSFKGGRALFNLAAARNEPIPVFAEMGSSNPLFLLPEALRERGGEIAAGFVEALTLGVGQFCTNPGLLFAVAGSDLEAFVSRVASLLGEKPAGVMLHRGIRETFVSNVSHRSRIAGVRSLGEVGEAGPGACLAAPVLLRTDAAAFHRARELSEEIFGPAAVLVECADREELLTAARRLRGQLTATLHGTAGDFAAFPELPGILEGKAGRLVCNGFPTGVEVSPAMVHGGPYPATTDSRFTSVGTAAIQRFLRPVCYQNFPPELLPEGLGLSAESRPG